MDKQPSAVIDASLFDTGSVAVFKWSAISQPDNPWPVIYASQNVKEIFGYKPEDLISGKVHFADLLHPEDLARVEDEVSRAVESGESHFKHVDYRIYCRDCSVRWVMDYTMIQRDQDGNPECFIGYLIDVTERKIQEADLIESEQRYRALFEGSQVVEFLLDPATGLIVDANRAACTFYGYSRADMKKMHINRINTLSQEQLKQAITAAEGGGQSHFVFKHRLSDGSVRDVEVHSGLIRYQGRELLYSIVHDITDRLEAERDLIKLSNALDQSGSIVMLTDSNHKIEFVNRQFTRVTGFNSQDVVGEHVDFLSAGRTSYEVRSKLSESLKQRKSWHGELLCRRKNGEVYWSSMSVSPVMDGDDEVSCVVAVAEDLTEQRETDRKIQQLAFFDPTTGLGNRQYLLDALDKFFIQHAGRRSRSDRTALIYIDLDDFKRINDSLGHEMGDRLIKTAAHRLKVVVNDQDILVRLGGDEFAILKHFESDLIMDHWLEQLVHQFIRTVKLGPHTLNMFASIGIAMLPDDASDTGTGLRNAELAMYRAKKAKGCGYQFFSEELNHQAVDRLHKEMKLRNALTDNELELYYQPKVHLDTGEVMGVEALVRWHDPENGMIPPGEFIPLAEETGLILPMSEWILEQACYQVVSWQQSLSTPLKMAVNLSVRQFQDPLFVQNVADILRKTGVNPALIELEITESMLMENMDTVLPMLDELKQLGVSLAIDDFGTGYSSLAYLKKMPIDVLKVDRAFVQDLPHDQNDCAITRAVILMAQQLGLNVVAEGIEDLTQAEFLTDNGCQLGQGFYYSRPLRLGDLESLLADSGLLAAGSAGQSGHMGSDCALELTD